MSGRPVAAQAKVLLFTQTGSERPKSQGTARLNEQGVPVAASGHRGYASSRRFDAAVESADRWWLVECESAAAGRGTILAIESSKPHDTVTPVGFPLGRILAHGGKERAA